MSRQLVLVAASGLAREAMVAAQAGGDYDVVGVVDDNPALTGELVGGAKVLGGLDSLADLPDVAVAICAGRGAVRRGLAERLRTAGIDEGRWATVVHPSVTVPASCSIGAGSVVLAGCVLTADVRMGAHAVLMPNVVLTHDDVVEDFVTLCAGVVLGGSVRIGAGAYVGMAASVRENVSIGAAATIGMGSAVLQDVPAGEVWFGVPATRRSMTAAQTRRTATI